MDFLISFAVNNIVVFSGTICQMVALFSGQKSLVYKVLFHTYILYLVGSKEGTLDKVIIGQVGFNWLGG